MASQVISLTIIISVMVTLSQGQSPQQDGQQQSGSCVCPSNAGFLTGPAGPPGAAGPQGLVGPQGPQGLTGPSGDPGANGIPGIPGQSGGQGLKGEKGDIGQGSRGQSGNPGQKGDRGLAGIPGPRGSPGKVGPQGIMGIQGIKGTQGHPGVKGQKGESDTSYTAPPMSAFSARRTADRHVISGSEIITFDVEDIDVGDDFNPSTGVFTCPTQGLYYFSFTLLPHYPNNAHIYLEQNGSRKAKIYYKSGSRYVMQSQSVILSLQVGDEVTLRAAAPTYITSSDQMTNTFNGYLIHAT